MQLRSLYKIRILCIQLLLLMQGAGVRAADNLLRHYVTVSVAGAEDNEWQAGERVKPLAGYGANIGVGYELQREKLIFGVGVQGQYQQTNTSVLDYSDAFEYANPAYADVKGQYQYDYTNYREHATGVAVTMPIYLGAQVEWFYLFAGGQVSYLVYTPYQIETDMASTIHADGYIVAHDASSTQNFIDMGVFPSSQYRHSLQRSEPLRAAATLELGGYLPVDKLGRHRMRLGAYCNMGFRLAGKKTGTNNYQNYEQEIVLAKGQDSWAEAADANIHWQSLTNTTRYTDYPIHVEVGIRLTMLINVRKPHKCNCLY